MLDLHPFPWSIRPTETIQPEHNKLGTMVQDAHGNVIAFFLDYRDAEKILERCCPRICDKTKRDLINARYGN